MSSDIGLGVVGIPNAGGMSKKPPHLIELTESKKTTTFVSLDRPEFFHEFIQVKGIYISSAKVAELEKDVMTFVSQISKDDICDMMFPTHRVLSIKNLAFKAK
jgi:hypothetical protein